MDNFQRNALGKGLSSLIPSATVMHKNGKNGSIEYLRIDSIIPNKNQPRKHFSEQELQELA